MTKDNYTFFEAEVFAKACRGHIESSHVLIELGRMIRAYRRSDQVTVSFQTGKRFRAASAD